jgi:beta-phosphoglucomutase-like phosphatase (HAD superfamily)
VLATRRAARGVVERLSEIWNEPAAVLLDFDGVEAVTSPFLDEVLKAIHAELAHGESSLVAAGGMNDDAYETLKMVLERNSRALTYREDDHYDLVTSVLHLAETYDVAKGFQREFTTPELAAALQLSVTGTNQRLKQLNAAGAVGRVRDPDAEHGKRYLYFAMSAATTVTAP